MSSVNPVIVEYVLKVDSESYCCQPLVEHKSYHQSRFSETSAKLQGVQPAGKTRKNVLSKKVAGKTRKKIINFKLRLEKLEMLNVRYSL